MGSSEIRCENESKLAEQLLTNIDVKRVRELIARAEEQGPLGNRRRLLSSAIRLSRSTAPELHRLVDHCVDRLEIKAPLETYVYPSPLFNAACFKPEEGRLLVMFSSSLLEAFSEKELLFIMGHELGHHVFQHHDIPIGYLLMGPERPPADLVLDLFKWSRYAEISADRAGAYCADDFEAVAHALFKLTSGLSNSKVVRFSLPEFLAQVDEMQTEQQDPGQGAPMQDWFSTHPFSPMRVRALQLFHESALMSPAGTSSAELELGVQSLMSLMEPDYLEGKTDTAKIMRLMFIAGAIAVADAEDGIGKQEAAVIKKYLGPAFSLKTISTERLAETLPARAAAACRLASESQRMQILRDLCNVALAEGDCTSKELSKLREIAGMLNVAAEFVDRCMYCNRELD
jgi:Zn-dependent protease with chaperone function